MIYLDNAATTKIDDYVSCYMKKYINENYANPGGLYSEGREAKHAIATARSQVANLINAIEENIIFTSGGSASNTLGIIGISSHLRKLNKMTIVTTAFEHESVIKAVDFLCENGFSKRVVHDVDKIEDYLDESVGLVCVMLENNETGILYNCKEVAKKCRDIGAFLHVDCVQGIYDNVVDVIDMDCDSLSIASHKIHGPKGVGALYVKDKELYTPIIFGTQECGLFGGTENVPAIAGFGAAADVHRQHRGKIIDKMEKLSSMIGTIFFNANDSYGISEDFHTNFSSKRIWNIRYDGVDSQALVLMASTRGVAISPGSACNGYSDTPSRVLMEYGLSDEEASESVRISISKYTEYDELRNAINIIAESAADFVKKNFMDGDK